MQRFGFCAGPEKPSPYLHAFVLPKRWRCTDWWNTGFPPPSLPLPTRWRCTDWWNTGFPPPSLPLPTMWRCTDWWNTGFPRWALSQSSSLQAFVLITRWYYCARPEMYLAPPGCRAPPGCSPLAQGRCAVTSWRGVVQNPFRLSLCCYALVCGANMATTLRLLRAEYYL